jgi:hypothetical protein
MAWGTPCHRPWSTMTRCLAGAPGHSHKISSACFCSREPLAVPLVPRNPTRAQRRDKSGCGNNSHNGLGQPFSPITCTARALVQNTGSSSAQKYFIRKQRIKLSPSNIASTGSFCRAETHSNLLLRVHFCLERRDWGDRVRRRPHAKRSQERGNAKEGGEQLPAPSHSSNPDTPNGSEKSPTPAVKGPPSRRPAVRGFTGKIRICIATFGKCGRCGICPRST